MDKPYQSTHWNYYLALEQDLMEVSRYIEFTEDNFATYSIELAHILLASASETDVLLKQLCSLLKPERKASAIKSYREVLAEHHEQFLEQGVVCPRFGLSLTPWSTWSSESGPDWWTSHNKVKHHRADHYKQANLSNALNSVAALFIINLEYMLQDLNSRDVELFFPSSMADVIKSLHTQSRLFKLDDLFAYLQSY